MAVWRILRLGVAWASVASVFRLSRGRRGGTTTPLGTVMFFAALPAIIVWCAFGVVTEADGLTNAWAASTIGLTGPALLVPGILTGQNVVLGLSNAPMVILALTPVLPALTFSGPRTSVLNGAMHLGIFAVYITLIFSP